MIGRAITTIGSFSAYEYAENDEKRSYGEKYNLSDGTLKDQWDEMRIIASLNDTVKRKKYVNAMISFDKSQNPENLINEQLKNIAETYAKEIGFYHNQWKFAVHTNTDEIHIHFFANRIGFDGKNSIKAHDIGRRSGQIADKIAKSLGFKTSKEIADERKKKALYALLKSCEISMTWDELETKMKDEGYYFILNKNAKGINGARIIPEEFYKSKNKLSEREKTSKKGYKLSELNRKIKINHIEQKLLDNQKNLQKQSTEQINYKKFKL